MSQLPKPVRPMKGVRVGVDQLVDLPYPVYASVKIDGIRAIVKDGVVFSTSGKPLPSKKVQELFGHMDGFDGELGYGYPTDKEKFHSETKSAVMSIDWPSRLDVEKLVFYVFDDWSLGNYSFEERYEFLLERPFLIDEPAILLGQHRLGDANEAEIFYDTALSLGYEGAIFKRANAKYKQGRATFLQGQMFKMKPFDDNDLEEAVVIGWEPLYRNCNAPKIDELGYQKRSAQQAGKVETELLGKFHCVDLKTGRKFACGGGRMTHKQRAEFYKEGDKLKGLVIQYYSMHYGVKDAPRHPNFKRIRDRIDLGPEDLKLYDKICKEYL